MNTHIAIAKRVRSDMPCEAVKAAVDALALLKLTAEGMLRYCLGKRGLRNTKHVTDDDVTALLAAMNVPSKRTTVPNLSTDGKD